MNLMQVWETLADWRKNKAARMEEKSLAGSDCCPGKRVLARTRTVLEKRERSGLESNLRNKITDLVDESHVMAEKERCQGQHIGFWLQKRMESATSIDMRSTLLQ